MYICAIIMFFALKVDVKGVKSRMWHFGSTQHFGVIKIFVFVVQPAALFYGLLKVLSSASFPAGMHMFLVKQPPAQHQMADSVRDELVDILVHLAAKGTDGVEGHQTRARDQVDVELI